MREGFLMLDSMERYADHALLIMRAFVGAFLIWGVWDNVISAERMQEFVAFLAKFGFVAPQFMAALSVWVQLLIGIGFVLGLLTRWAAVLCIINFAVAIVMVDRFGGLRGAFPSGCLVVIGLYLATRGAGRFSLDEIVGRRREAHRRASEQIPEGAAV
jgi:putative oxidoreductase